MPSNCGPALPGYKGLVLVLNLTQTHDTPNMLTVLLELY